MDGGFDFIRHLKGIYYALKGTRKNFKPAMREILAKLGNIPIIEMYVCRRPLTQKFKKILEFINNASNFRGETHDKLFHLFIILRLENNVTVMLEKNEDLNIDYYKASPVDERIQINFNPPLTMNVMLANAISKYGNTRIFQYNAFSTNCQRFVLDVLEANGVQITQEIQTFILQDVRNLVPSWSQKLAFGITSFYNRLKMAFQGYGELDIRNMPNRQILQMLRINY